MCATSNHDCVWEELTHSKKSLPNPISPKAPSVWTLCAYKPRIFKSSSLQVSALVYLHLYLHSTYTCTCTCTSTHIYLSLYLYLYFHPYIPVLVLVLVLLHLLVLPIVPLFDLQALYTQSAISLRSLVSFRCDLCLLFPPQAHQLFLCNNAISAKPYLSKPLILKLRIC